MNYTQLIQDLTKQIEHLTAARDSLKWIEFTTGQRKPGTITPAGRARIAAAQRARHAKAKRQRKTPKVSAA